MFQFRRFPAYAYFVQRRLLEYCSSGFPHSEISGSMRMCRSPKLIAACHVLLRFLMPRHSPCARISLTSSGQSPHPSLPPTAKAHPFRCPSSPNRTRFAGLRFGLRARPWWVLLPGPKPILVLKNHAGFRVLQLNCFPLDGMTLAIPIWFSQSKPILCRLLPFLESSSHCSVFKVRLSTLS